MFVDGLLPATPTWGTFHPTPLLPRRALLRYGWDERKLVTAPQEVLRRLQDEINLAETNKRECAAPVRLHLGLQSSPIPSTRSEGLEECVSAFPLFLVVSFACIIPFNFDLVSPFFFVFPGYKYSRPFVFPFLAFGYVPFIFVTS
ncbi:hypothetical protein B0H19DRAFT_593092 [Mycena capillaripes]|nr:hypothetical protein B0H19DRAFT_593092 [Mycena capillaripes]